MERQSSRSGKAGVAISMTELAQLQGLMEQSRVKLDTIRGGK